MLSFFSLLENDENVRPFSNTVFNISSHFIYCMSSLNIDCLGFKMGHTIFSFFYIFGSTFFSGR